MFIGDVANLASGDNLWRPLGIGRRSLASYRTNFWPYGENGRPIQPGPNVGITEEGYLIFGN